MPLLLSLKISPVLLRNFGRKLVLLLNILRVRLKIPPVLLVPFRVVQVVHRFVQVLPPAGLRRTTLTHRKTVPLQLSEAKQPALRPKIPVSEKILVALELELADNAVTESSGSYFVSITVVIVISVVMTTPPSPTARLQSWIFTTPACCPH